MNINRKFSRTDNRSLTKALSTVIALLFCGNALAQGADQLIGVIPGFPQFDATGGPGQLCTFDAASMKLTIESTPNLYFPDPNSLERVDNGLMTLTATLDLMGNVTAGTVVINGTTTDGVTDPLLTDPLFQGDLVEIGLENSNMSGGTTDASDFRVTPTGGSVVADPAWNTGDELVATMTLVGSNYDGMLNADWMCDNANLILGATTPYTPPQPPGEIEVDIDVKPGSDPSCLNINGKGVVPVAILGSDTLDVTMIDQESLLFAGLSVYSPGNGGPQCNAEDINNDSFDDLVCQFEDDQDKWSPDSKTAATLTGLLFDATKISGTGEICLVGGGSSALNPLFVVLLSLLALFRRRLK